MAVKPVDMNTITITTQMYSDIISREKFLQKFFSSEYQLTLTAYASSGQRTSER